LRVKESSDSLRNHRELTLFACVIVGCRAI
jgi:hypothetical protein